MVPKIALSMVCGAQICLEQGLWCQKWHLGRVYGSKVALGQCS